MGFQLLAVSRAATTAHQSPVWFTRLACALTLCSCLMAVVDGDFRVYGTRNLRIVDASVFPWIPGFFIVSSIYMISEKASDVILADAGN